MPEGFTCECRGEDVVISHYGPVAATSRGRAAQQFLDDVEREAPQLLMARLTGNDKRGNERVVRNHPRNRSCCARQPPTSPREAW